VIERQNMLKLGWLVNIATIDNDTEIVIAVKAANPFKPSIRLKALITPAEAKTVKTMPMGAKEIIVSMYGMPTLDTQMLQNKTISALDTQIAINLRSGDIEKPRSSTVPIKNIGRPAITNDQRLEMS